MEEEEELQKTAVAHEVAIQETVDADGQDENGKAEATMVPQAEIPIQTSDENIQEAPPLITNGMLQCRNLSTLPWL